MLKFLMIVVVAVAASAAQAQYSPDPQSVASELLRRHMSPDWPVPRDQANLEQENKRLQLELQNRQLRDRLANPESYVAPLPSPGTQCTVIGLGHGDAAVDCN